MTLPSRDIGFRIRVIRGLSVLLDSDIAELYGVSTKRVNQAVKRNVWRFPRDFVFRLTVREFKQLEPPLASDSRPGGRRYLPYAFTELGAGMVASVLRTPITTDVSIAILRTFVRQRSVHEVRDDGDHAGQRLFDAIRDVFLITRDDLPYTTRVPYTYFVQAGADGPIKIGSTRNLPVRLGSLRATVPVPLRLIGLIEGDVEDFCHAELRAFRLHGEWFAPAPEVMAFIREHASGRQADALDEPARKKRRANPTPG